MHQALSKVLDSAVSGTLRDQGASWIMGRQKAHEEASQCDGWE